MESYKEKYEQALRVAKETYDKQPMYREWLEKMFPELKESEDEKIREALIRFHKSTIDIDGIKGADIISWLEKQKEPLDKGEISDGYHTFNELYYYRMLYNAAFFNLLPKEWVHKSKKHHTGEECFGGGWFIVMAELPTGQISNHYEMKDWDLFDIPEKDVADEWDGHTPQEAAERLHNYLLEKQGEQKFEMKTAEESLGIDSDTYNKIVDECIFGEQKPEENKGNLGGISSNSAWSEEEERYICQLESMVKERWALAEKAQDEEVIKNMSNLAFFLKTLNPNKKPTDEEMKTLLRTEYEKGRADAIAEMQNRWSEEDKSKRNALIGLVEEIKRQPLKRLEDWDGYISWLKSLRPQNTYNPYKAVVESIAEMCKHYDKASHSGLRDFYDNVKVKCKDAKEYDRMFPQNHWKPSDEQMMALLYHCSNGSVLSSLYNDLNKLKEE